MLVIAAFALLQQQVPQDTNRSQKLEAITVSEKAGVAHRYRAPWSASALKVSTPLRDTPASVSVITNALIREQSLLSVGDALRYVPGVTVGQGEGNRDAITIRGNASTADFFVDGLRDDAQYFRDLYNVERVEALGGANALTFGRGGGGGVVNRVSKRAGFQPVHDATLESGSYGHGRAAVDVGGALDDRLAGRVNALYQNSGSFRYAYRNTRLGFSPQLSWAVAPATTFRFGAEYFSDARTADRGIPSYRGRPSPAALSTFFGNPDSSHAQAQAMSGDVSVEHRASEFATVRSTLRFTRYDKFYQNVYPGGAVDTSGMVRLSAYNQDIYRSNVFSQNEAVLRVPSSRVPHTLLVGVEIGRQATDNVRQTGYFGGTPSLTVPFDAPTVYTPVEFRPSSTDADNFVLANVASLYAQDQIWLTPKLQATVGARAERFDLGYRNNRAPQRLHRRDDVFSPRAGLVFKPVEPLSLYASISVSHLPSAGDQFGSLTPTTRTLEPERFTNQEAGVKWDVVPALSVTGAVYALVRTNSAAPSAVDPGVYVQTGRQKTTGVEVALNGSVLTGWDVVGAFASQRAKIVSRTNAAPAGAIVPLVPRNTFSLWNRVRLARAIAVGFGSIHQSDMYAAIDDMVTLPGFWRFDGAIYAQASRHAKVQVNMENLFNRAYYATSHGNNNIMPGAPRMVKVSVVTSVK